MYGLYSSTDEWRPIAIWAFQRTHSRAPTMTLSDSKPPHTHRKTSHPAPQITSPYVPQKNFTPYLKANLYSLREMKFFANGGSLLVAPINAPNLLFTQYITFYAACCLNVNKDRT